MKSSKGFTLIELVVVMAVFLFIIGAAIGIFISIVQNQKKVLAEQQLLSQISYVEEYMSKAIRMAAVAGDNNCIAKRDIYLLQTWNSSVSAYTDIKFVNQSSNICQEFLLDKCDPANPAIPVLCEKKAGGAPVALTSANMQINYIKFIINGSTNQNSDKATSCAIGSDQCIQPRLTILLNISIPGESARTIQTTISQRNLNVQQ